jgi:G3E family GTPase
MADRLPVVLVTGFLGSGKTTLIAALLAHPDMGETAVLVNELGEVAIDHHLVRRVDERTVVLASGCVCCTLRGDLRDELRDLLARRDRGEIAPLRRVVVETTGLADPAPVLSTLLTEPLLRHHYEVEAVVATVDALNGAATLDRHPESRKQAAVADTLLVTKADAAPAAATEALEARLRALNPLATVRRVAHGAIAPRDLLAGRARDPSATAVPATGDHGEDVHAFAIVRDEPLDWDAFAVWLTIAPAQPRSRRPAGQGTPGRRRAGAGRPRRRAARRPPPAPPRDVARRRPPHADRLHHARDRARSGARVA